MWARSMATTFLENPRSADSEGWIRQLVERWDPARAWGVTDRGRWVATLRTEPRRLSVPGPAGQLTEVHVDALTNVTVAGTHRRRGLMSRMLSASLREARERGETLSVLIAAEWPIYGRFGYAPATVAADYTLHSRRPGAHCPGDPTQLRQVEASEVLTVAPKAFERTRSYWAGQMDRDEVWWRRSLGLGDGSPGGEPAHNWFLHEGQDGVDGLLGWSGHGEESLLSPQQSVQVRALFTSSEVAYRDMWSYLAGLDMVDRVTLPLRPVSEPVRWLLEDGRALETASLVDFLWLRLLDVPAALRARTYSAADELVLQVTDRASDAFAQGRYALAAGAERVECERTEREPDLEIDQRALASMYLGGFRLEELLPADVAREFTSGALTRLDRMFACARPPWNATWF